MNPRTLLAAILLVGAALPWGQALAQEGRTIAIHAELHETAYGLHMVPERIDARVGDTLQVEVVNRGAARHNLIFCGDETVGRECRDVWGGSRILGENETDSFTVQVQRPGTYEFYCSLPGHREGGMGGQMFVAGEAPEKSLPLSALLPLAAAALAALLLVRRR